MYVEHGKKERVASGQDVSRLRRHQKDDQVLFLLQTFI